MSKSIVTQNSYDPGQPASVRQLGDITWAVESFREPGKVYVVCMEGYSCNCKAYTHSKRAGLPCKHLEAVAAQQQAEFERGLATEDAMRAIFA